MRTGRSTHRGALLAALGAMCLSSLVARPAVADPPRTGVITFPSASATLPRLAFLAGGNGANGLFGVVYDLGSVPDGHHYALENKGGLGEVRLTVDFYSSIDATGGPCTYVATPDGDGGETGSVSCGGLARYAIVTANLGIDTDASDDPLAVSVMTHYKFSI